MNNFYVYVHYRESDSLPFYVGKGKGNRAYQFSGRNEYWNRTYKKHGARVEIVFENLTEDESFQLEIDTILEFKYFGFPLTNMTNGGEGTSGHKQSEETIKLRVSKTTGQKRTKETRDKISKANRGKKRSEEVSAKLSAARKGVKRDPLVVEKIANSNRGKKRNQEFRDLISEIAKQNAIKTNLSERTRERNMDKTIYRFQHPDFGIFIGTRYDFCIKYNIKQVTLNNFFNRDHQKTVKGWTIEEFYE